MRRISLAALAAFPLVFHAPAQWTGAAEPARPDPVYGGQLQDFGTSGQPAEGFLHIDWTERPAALAGGEAASPRAPSWRIEDMAHGPFHPGTVLSPRIAPPTIGLGLLEAIPAGREPAGGQRGLAAGPALDPVRRRGAGAARRGADDPETLAGKRLFHEAGCAACHRPRFVTGARAGFPELSDREIRPYTDMLPHDMGDGLADRRADGAPAGDDGLAREWRTPPLWGIGLTETVNGHTFFPHDGRARSLLEAIL